MNQRNVVTPVLLVLLCGANVDAVVCDVVVCDVVICDIVDAVTTDVVGDCVVDA